MHPINDLFLTFFLKPPLNWSFWSSHIINDLFWHYKFFLNEQPRKTLASPSLAILGLNSALHQSNYLVNLNILANISDVSLVTCMSGETDGGEH